MFLSLPQGSLCVTTRLGGGEKGACREREAKREEGPRLLLFPSSPRAYYFCLTVAQKTPTFPFFLNRKLNLTSMAVKTRTTNSITSTWHVHQAFGRILDIVFFLKMGSVGVFREFKNYKIQASADMCFLLLLNFGVCMGFVLASRYCRANVTIGPWGLL